MNESLHRAYYQRLREYARSGYARSLSKPTDWIDFELQEGIKRNISDFAAGKQESLLAELRKSYAVNPSNFDKAAKGIMSRYNKMYLKTELGTFEAASNTASQWRWFEDNKVFYPNLQFNTVGDDRVRPLHMALDGATYPINDPFWNTHTPPLDWRCRCILLQTDEAVNEKPVQQARKGLGGNPFKNKALVTDSHPYFERSNDLADLRLQSDNIRAILERPGILKRTREQLKSMPLKNGKQTILTDADLLNIVNTQSDNEAVRNAILSAINLAINEMTASGAAVGAGLEAYEVSVLGVTYLLTFESGEALTLKTITEI